MDKVIVGLAGAILGFLSGLFMPWVKWEIKKRRLHRSRREQLIEKWRQAISSENFDAKSFLQSREYSELRVHLSEEVAGAFEAKYTIVSLSTTRPNAMQNELFDEVARLEKEWGLV